MNRLDPTYTLPAPRRIARGRLVAQALLMTLPLLSITVLTVVAPFAGRTDACVVSAAAQDAGAETSSGIQSSSP